MSEKENPNYYAIIPANVRYCKEIPANAKLLYGEITALCNQKGYCWASNDYFAKLYGVSKQSISTWISKLEKNKFISIQMIYKEGTKEILNRYIKILVYPIQENLNTPIQENLKDNITSINNTTNNTNETNIPSKQEIQIQEQFLIFYQNYPKKVDKTDSKKVFTSLLKKGIKLDSILSKLKIYEKQIKQNNTELKYIRSPARFLRTMDDYEDTEIKKRDIIKQYCKKCGEILLDGTCSKCYALHDIEGELI
jgi:hypothetical protein